MHGAENSYQIRDNKIYKEPKNKDPMKRKNRIIYYLLAALLLTCRLHAQNFSYSVSRDSAAYIPLDAPQTIAANQNWISKNFIVHLPFSFNFCGSLTDSVSIYGNGFIDFNIASKLAIIAFNSFSSQRDTAQQYAGTISYQVTGAGSSRILKIQFSDVAQSQFSAFDYLNYQVWLYEGSNAIEFHIGNNSYSNAPNSMPVALGVLNRMGTSSSRGYFISGSPFSPAGQLIGNDDELSYLTTIPAAGVILKLSPSF